MPILMLNGNDQSIGQSSYQGIMSISGLTPAQLEDKATQSEYNVIGDFMLDSELARQDEMKKKEVKRIAGVSGLPNPLASIPNPINDFNKGVEQVKKTAITVLKVAAIVGAIALSAVCGYKVGETKGKIFG